MPAAVQERLDQACTTRDGIATLAPTLHYLGSSGLLRVQGLRVAFCGGVWDGEPAQDWTAPTPTDPTMPADYSAWDALAAPVESAQALSKLLRHPAVALGEARAPVPPRDPGSLQQARAFQFAQGTYEFQLAQDAPVLQERRPVDLLLTTAWPLGIDALSEVPRPDDAPSWGRAPIARLAEACRPRYHLACAPPSVEHGVYWEREPYENPPLAALPPPATPAVTRFVSLAHAANPAKVRWFLALSLVPADELADAAPRPANLTPSPLWMLPRPTAPVKRARPAVPVSTDHEPRRKRRVQAVGPDSCWFCLSNPELEKHLIVSVGHECYVALPKGQLPRSTDDDTLVPGGGHVLIVPIVHTPSLYAPDATPALRAEVAAWLEVLRACYASLGAVAVSWDVVRRGTRAGHSQTQVVPIPRDEAGAVVSFFHEAADRAGLSFETEADAQQWLDGHDAASRTDYCCIVVDTKPLLLLLRGERFNIQFPRYVALLMQGNAGAVPRYAGAQRLEGVRASCRGGECRV